MVDPFQRRPPFWLRFLDKTNLTVSGLTACVVLFTRSVGVAYFTAGAVLCSLTVKLLKRAIRQSRPRTSHQKPTYGMPSTHSATISFFAAYILLACLRLPLHPSFPSGLITRITLPLITLPWAISIVFSRVWLRHHTWPQVAVGASYGIAFAFTWFVLWNNGLNEYSKEAERALGTVFV